MFVKLGHVIKTPHASKEGEKSGARKVLEEATQFCLTMRGELKVLRELN